MKAYKTKGMVCWDAIAAEKLSSEFDLDILISAQYDTELYDYLILPENTTIEIPDDIVVESTQFLAPWEV